MNHADLLQKLPSSIYSKESDSNNAKLWSLVASEANAIENAIAPFYDVDAMSGLDLDKLALIVGIERDGRSDADFRNALFDLCDCNANTASLPAVYSVLESLKTDGLLSSYSVTELAYEREMEDDPMDGFGFWDGLGPLDPTTQRPKVVEFWDGNGTLDGLEPMEPCFIRPASILVEVEVGNSHLPEIIIEIRKVLVVGVGLYCRCLPSP